ncbi:MAG: hypothetical protein Q9170_004876 [Blastenia crenularia]
MKPALALTILPLLANAYKGDMTHYTPGLGSCGHYNDPAKAEPVVALSREIMANGPNPNTNPKCGKKIDIYNSRTKTHHQATVVDTCWACKKEDIDVNVKLFDAVEPKGDGRVHGIQWGWKKSKSSFDGEAEVAENGMGLVEQPMGGSMRFRKVETIKDGCGKVASKVTGMFWSFWES